MRNAMKAAKKDKRFSNPLRWDMQTLRIEHRRRYTPLGRRIDGGERPSDIIRKYREAEKELKEELRKTK